MRLTPLIAVPACLVGLAGCGGSECVSKATGEEIDCAAGDAVSKGAYEQERSTAAQGDEQPLGTSDPGTTVAPIDLVATSEGGSAQGVARFGVTLNDEPYLDLELDGLSEPSSLQTYVIWVMTDEDHGYPLAPLDDLAGQRFDIPSSAAPLVSRRGTTLNINLADNREMARVLQEAKFDQDVELDEVGTTYLEGDIQSSE